MQWNKGWKGNKDATGSQRCLLGTLGWELQMLLRRPKLSTIEGTGAPGISTVTVNLIGVL